MCAFLVCLRMKLTRGSKLANIWIAWDSPEELAEADRELLDDVRGCGPGCERTHLLVWADWCEYGYRYHVQPSVHDPHEPPPLDEELAACYPRPPGEREALPVAPELNEPLERQRDGSVLAEQMQRGKRISLARLLATAP